MRTTHRPDALIPCPHSTSRPMSDQIALRCDQPRRYPSPKRPIRPKRPSAGQPWDALNERDASSVPWDASSVPANQSVPGLTCDGTLGTLGTLRPQETTRAAATTSATADQSFSSHCGSLTAMLHPYKPMLKAHHSTQSTRSRSVFPAYAGVFPRRPRRHQGHRRLPRVRGGVPASICSRSGDGSSSPRTRGCSPHHPEPRGDHRVFPAYAGVFRRCQRCRVFRSGLPRVRGGVPTTTLIALTVIASSPRTRGCSHVGDVVLDAPGVFPAYAGVFRRPGARSTSRPSLPRVRGGVPPLRGLPPPGPRSSPRTRGCSLEREPRVDPAAVFPAYAGVFRS